MSTEQTTVEQQGIVADEPENVVSAPVIDAEQQVVIEEGAKVLPISALAGGAESGAQYLSEEDYKKYTEGKLGKKEETDATEQQTEAVEAAAPTFDETAWLKEKTGGKFEKWDDVASKLEAQPELNFENEQSKTVYEYIQQGKLDEIAQFIVLQKALAGAENASDEEVIKMKMRIEESDLEADDLDLAFEVEFEKPNEDEMDEASYKKAMLVYNRKLKKAATEARSFLGERKAELKLPALSQPKTEQQGESPVAKFEQDVQETMGKIHESVNQALANTKEFSLQFTNNKDVVVDYKYSYSDQEKKQVGEVLKDYGQYFESRYATKEGGYDGAKLAQDVLVLQNLDKIMQAAVTDAIMKERLEIINKNANYNSGREVVTKPVDVVREQERKDAQRVFES